MSVPVEIKITSEAQLEQVKAAQKSLFDLNTEALKHEAALNRLANAEKKSGLSNLGNDAEKSGRQVESMGRIIHQAADQLGAVGPAGSLAAGVLHQLGPAAAGVAAVVLTGVVSFKAATGSITALAESYGKLT